MQGDDPARPPARVAFAHMDADLYSSTVDVLGTLASRGLLRRGSVVAFDELFGHATVANQEWRALREVAARFGLRYRFVTYMLHPESKYGRAAIKIE